MKVPVDNLLEGSKTLRRTGSFRVDNQESINIHVGNSWNHHLTTQKNKSQKRIWYIYAVTISLVLVVSAGVYLQSLNNKLVKVVANYNVVEHLMPDGSKVWLKPGSVLSYPQSFGIKNRGLNLNGTGFFEVIENGEFPFTISSTRSTVEVFGASFLYKTNQESNVQVFAGSLKFENNQSGKSEKLERGQTATMVNGNSIEFLSFDQNSISWKTGTLAFKNEGLNQVLEYISEHYKVELYTNKLSSMNITATFDNLSLEEVIKRLNKMTNLDIKARLK